MLAYGTVRTVVKHLSLGGKWVPALSTGSVPPTLSGMAPPKRKAAAAKLRPWRVPLMRARAQQLGVVYAPDEKSAEAAAIAEYKIGEEQRRRLIVRENE